MPDGTTDEERKRAALEYERQWEEEIARFDELMASCGGPADVCQYGKDFLDDFALDQYRMAVRDYPWEKIKPLLEKYVKGKRGKSIAETTLLKYWPAIMDVLHRYKRARSDLEGSPYCYPVNQSPAQIEDLLLRIANNTYQLWYDLKVLEKIALLPPHPNAPQERAHLRRWYFCLRKAIANGGGRNAQYYFEPRENLGAHCIADALNSTFEGSLETLGYHAREILGGEFDRTLLKHRGSRRDPALYILVEWVAVIWEALTGRKASAEKNESKHQSDDATDFVKFVRALIKLAGFEDEPTRVEVQLCLKPHKERSRLPKSTS